MELLSRSLFYWMFGGYSSPEMGIGLFVFLCLDPCFTMFGGYKLSREPEGSLLWNLSRSLFYWMFGGYSICCENGRKIFVSILVLLDVWWVRGHRPLPRYPPLGVSILVLLDVWWVLWRLHSTVAICFVSILVLLDVWWVPQKGFILFLSV